MRKTLSIFIFLLLMVGCSEDKRVLELSSRLQDMASEVTPDTNESKYAEKLKSLETAFRSFDEITEQRLDSFPIEAKKAVELYQDFHVFWKAPSGKIEYVPNEAYVGHLKQWLYTDRSLREKYTFKGLIEKHRLASPPKSTIARVREKALKTARDQVDTAIAELE
jgi:uncharacterized protein YcfL